MCAVKKQLKYLSLYAKTINKVSCVGCSAIYELRDFIQADNIDDVEVFLTPVPQELLQITSM